MNINVYTDYQNYQKKILINRFISSTIIGYLATKFFTSINPINALIFNGAIEIINFISNKMFTYLKQYKIFQNSKLDKCKCFFKATILFTSTFLLMNLFFNFSFTNTLITCSLTAICQITIGILGIGAIIGSFAKYSLDIFNTLKILKA